MLEVIELILLSYVLVLSRRCRINDDKSMSNEGFREFCFCRETGVKKTVLQTCKEIFALSNNPTQLLHPHEQKYI